MKGTLLQRVAVVIGTVLTLVVCSVTSGPLGTDPVVSNTAYCLQIYNYINTYRSKHIAPALKWNRTLNDIAENIAMELVTSPNTTIDPEDFEGVNYFGVQGGRPQASTIVNKWYNESMFYNYDSPSFSHSYANFTQMVWKSSKYVGIGTATYDNFTVIIARFSQSGNVNGGFKANVIPLRKIYR